MIDTLTIYLRLKSTHLKEEAAREIAYIFRDVIESNLVLKTNLEAAKCDPTKAMEIMKTDLVKAIEIMKTDLVKVIERTRADIIKWVAGMLVAQAAIVATLVKLL